MTTSKQALTGILLDSRCKLTLEELSDACSVRREYIIELVEEGIVEPLEQSLDQQQWCFTGKSLVRARKARRLQNDLGVNLAGAALVIEMIEEIDHLRERLRYLDKL